MPSKPFPSLAFLALLTGGVGIGFAPIFMRLSDVGPLASAFWRMALAAPLLWVWALSAKKQDDANQKHTHFSRVLLWAGLWFGADMGFYHLSLHYTRVADATLLSNLAPVLIVLWMAFKYRTRFTRTFIIGGGITLAGATLLVQSTAGSENPLHHPLLGAALGLGSALFYGAYQLTIKEARDSYSTARLMAWSTSITALTLLPFALAAPAPFWPHYLSGWLPLLGLALVGQIGGQTIISYASAHLPPSLSSIALLIQPLTSAIAAWLLFHEGFTPIQMVGALFLLGGIYLSKRGSHTA